MSINPLSPEIENSHRPSDVGNDLALWSRVFALGIAVALLLLLIFVALAVKKHPTVGPDEFGFLIGGQHLKNNSEPPLSPGLRSFYMIGYVFVSYVAALIGGTIKAQFTILLVINIVLVVLTGVLLAQIATRHFLIGKNLSCVIAVAASALPTIAAHSMFSWSESLSRFSFVFLVFLVFEYARNGRLVVGLGASLLMSWMLVTHGRFALVVPLLALTLLFPGGRVSRKSLQTSAICISFLVVACLIMRRANLWLQTELYPSAGGKEGRNVAKLFDVGNYDEMARALLSQSWYVIGTSFGIAVFGIFQFAVGVRNGIRRREFHRVIPLVFVLGAVLAILLTDSLQLISVIRPDHLAYGRYPEVITPVLILGGFLYLKSHESPRIKWWIAPSALSMSCVLLLLGLRGDNLYMRMARGEYFEFANGIGLDVPKHLLQPMGYVSVTIFFSVISALILLLFKRKAELGLACFILVAVACTAFTVTSSIAPRREAATHLTLDNRIKELRSSSSQSIVGVDSRLVDIHDYFDYRFQTHPILVQQINFGKYISPEILCAIGSPDRPPRDDWERVGVEETLNLVLWKRGGVDSC